MVQKVPSLMKCERDTPSCTVGADSQDNDAAYCSAPHPASEPCPMAAWLCFITPLSPQSKDLLTIKLLNNLKLLGETIIL